MAGVLFTTISLTPKPKTLALPMSFFVVSEETATVRVSPLYDKGHPILGVFVHGRSFLEFWTRKCPC